MHTEIPTVNAVTQDINDVVAMCEEMLSRCADDPDAGIDLPMKEFGRCIENIALVTAQREDEIDVHVVKAHLRFYDVMARLAMHRAIKTGDEKLFAAVASSVEEALRRTKLRLPHVVAAEAAEQGDLSERQ